MIEGTVTFGCREFTTVETLAKICKHYKEKYPLVQIAIHTATADTIYEMMNKGLVDIALFMEPIDTEGFDYIRMKDSDHWVVGVCPDDPLADKKYIEKKDLLDKPLLSFISNLGTNAGVMATNGLGYPISIEGAVKYWREDLLVQRRLYPEITANCVIAWRRNIPYSQAVNKMIEEINAYDEIILGFPIWWYVAPTIVNTFLEKYNFSGKKIILFATSGGSGFGNTARELQTSAPDSVITEGKIFHNVVKQQIAEWVGTL